MYFGLVYWLIQKHLSKKQGEQGYVGPAGGKDQKWNKSKRMRNSRRRYYIN